MYYIYLSLASVQDFDQNFKIKILPDILKNNLFTIVDIIMVKNLKV